MKQPGRLAVRADRGLAGDRCEEPAIECATREVTHDPRPNGVDEREALAADVERRRPIEEDRLHPVVERHRRLHVEDDGDRDAVGGFGWQPVLLEEPRAISAPSTSKHIVFLGIRVNPTSCMSEAVHRICGSNAHPSPAAIAAPQQYARTECVSR